jgi:hypothetical protein
MTRLEKRTPRPPLARRFLSDVTSCLSRFNSANRASRRPRSAARPSQSRPLSSAAAPALWAGTAIGRLWLALGVPIALVGRSVTSAGPSRFRAQNSKTG